MHTPSLLLLVALAVVPAIAAPCDKGCGSSTRAVKRQDSSRSLEQEGDSSEDSLYQKTACGGELSKNHKSSSFKTAAKSADNSYESYSSTGGVRPCGCGKVNCGCGRTLIVRRSGESDYDYYRRAFVIDETCGCEDKILVFYKSVFQQYEGECDADYVKRIDYIFSKCYPRLDCRYNSKYEQFLKKYYLTRYSRLAQETDEAWFKRCLTRTTESETVYKSRVLFLQKYITNVNWSLVKIDCKSTTGYTVLAQSSTRSLDSSCGCKSQTKTIITEEDVRKSCARLSSEDETTYFRRILKAKSTFKSTQEYITYYTYLQKCYPKIKVWYCTDYADLIKDYYTTLYTRQVNEKDDIYYKRITTKYEYETEEQFCKRLDVIRCCYPTLPLWTEKTFYEKYTKNYFLNVYKKIDTEDYKTYVNRVIKRCEGETDLVYVNRLDLIRCSYPHLPIWYSRDYLDQISKYYRVKYVKQSTETDVQLYERLVRKESWESDEEYVNRLECVRQLYPDYQVFYRRDFYEKYSKIYFRNYYKQFSYEKDLTTYYKRITAKCEKETDLIYVQRLQLVEETFPDHKLWYSEEYFNYVSSYYKLKYTRLSEESEQVYIKRVFAKCGCDKSDVIYANRLHMVHLCTPSQAFWYEEKYYESYTKAYYSVYYKKGDQACDLWLKNVITILNGETEDLAFKRIALIRKSTASCGCWTAEYLKKIESCFSAAYIKRIRTAYFVSEVSEYSRKSSSTKSCVKEGESNEEEIHIKRGGGCK